MKPGDVHDAAILIVDDQQANLDLLETFLADAGYTCLHVTTDARRVMDLCRAMPPDLILLDLHMPHLDGFAVLQQLEPLTAHGAYLPVLVLTADATPAVRQRALSGGAKDFLTKPLDETETLLRIRNLLETRALHLQLAERNQALESTVQELAREREVSERLLLNVLPGPIAERLKRDEGTIAESFPEVTVLFADIVDFTAISATLAAEEVVAWLNELFSAFDRLASRHGLEKIKTIGDCYMAVGGLPTPRADHLEAVANFALELRSDLQRHVAPNGEPLRMRIGAHTGQVVAGVIGRHKFTYDLWGDTVNIASRMVTHGVDGAIQVTPEIEQRLRDRYAFEDRGEIEIKGRGLAHAWLLTGLLT